MELEGYSFLQQRRIRLGYLTAQAAYRRHMLTYLDELRWACALQRAGML